MKKYDVIIFDLDGTLSNSGEGITKSVQYALKRFGIIEENLDNLKHFVGPPMKEEMMKSYGFTEEQATEAVSVYRERYVPIGLYETSLYEGIVDLLENLKKHGKMIAMATSKPQSMAEEVVRTLEIETYFDYIMGADLIGGKQKKEDVLKALLEILPVKNKEKMLMVGDTIFDVEGAKAVGIDCMGVSYGYGDKEDMLKEGAVSVADSAEDLLKDILGQ